MTSTDLTDAEWRAIIDCTFIATMACEASSDPQVHYKLGPMSVMARMAIERALGPERMQRIQTPPPTSEETAVP